MNNVQLQQDIRKELNERLAAWQKGLVFPEHLYPKQFPDWVKIALSQHSPAGLRMPVAEFVEICEKPTGKLTYWDLGAIFHMMETRTAQDMKMPLSEYCNYQMEIERLISTWRATVEPKNRQLQEEGQKEYEKRMKKMQEEEAEKLANEGVGEAPPDEQTNIIPLVRGEA